MSNPASDKPRKGAVGDQTSQKCDGCGEMYGQDSAAKHLDCNYSMANFQATPAPAPQESDRTIVYSESNVEKSNPASEGAGKRKPGDPNWPEEVRNAAKEPKNLLNQYILVAQIGKGGMGTVWKAFDRSLLRWVAIKFLTTSDGNEEGVLRFKREAQLAGGLRHPNIAPIYEVGEARGQHFIAMEFIDGASMANAQLPMKDMLDIFIKVAQGIEAAHKKGVIHRDLKPQNIMLTSDNWPYVMDFGLAKALRGDSSLSVTGAVMGTPAYMPPEQAQGKLELIDHQSDVYSLGATMYAILSRKTPFQAETAMDILMKVCNEEPVPPRKHNAEIPADIETIILKAMQKKKEDRYGSSQDLADDLKRFVSNEEIQATRPGFLTHVMRRAKRNKSMVIASSVIVILAAVVGAVVLKKPPPPPVVIGDNGSTGEAAEILQAREKWKLDWQRIALDLDFDDWKQGQNPKLGEQAAAHLKEIDKLQIKAEALHTLVVEWYSNEIKSCRREVERIHDDSSTWTRNKDKVMRAQNWCNQIALAGAGYDLLQKPAESLVEIHRMAEAITGYKGTFTLLVSVAPWASVELKKGDKAVPIQDQSTPLTVRNLEVGDYTLVLKHDEHGTHEIPLKGIEAGKNYIVKGLMSDKSTISVKPQ
jgi:serine/threonine protein kinase